MNEVQTYLLATVVIPVLLLILKNLLKDELTYWIEFFNCYFHRPFDLDKNTKTHDWVMLYNAGTGGWDCCSLTFHFGLDKGENGVFIYHYDDEWKIKFTERMSFANWRSTKKAKLARDNLPLGLEDRFPPLK